MHTKIKTIINEELDNLPKEMREVIDSLDWTTIIEEIADRHLLFDEEIDDLQIETLLVLVGMEDVDSYASNIENEVGTTEAEANKIR